MRFALTWLLCAACTLSAAQSLPYPRALAQWQESSAPSPSDQAAYAIWSYAANNSLLHWHVQLESSQPVAELAGQSHHALAETRPRFMSDDATLGEAKSFHRLKDGWLVGFNHGEWGGALYWFDTAGTRKYKISGHQIVSFIDSKDGIRAIEGLAHADESRGSLIQISRDKGTGRWQASTVTPLPRAPFAVSMHRDGRLLITLSDALVTVDRKGVLRAVLENAPWAWLYPSSSTLSADERMLYIGMRQFVGEFDLSRRRLRLLIPSRAFLNKLSLTDEARIRHQHSAPGIKPP